MFKTSKKISYFFTIIFLFFFIASLALAAENPMSNLESAGQGAKYNVNVGENTIPDTIGKIVAIVLSFVGSIFLILTIYSGIQWMTAGGNEDKVKQARTRLINSVMGLAITIMAYFITYLISTTLLS